MKILIVDDEPSVLEFLVESIRLQGHQAVTARDGCEGLEIFRAEAPDLVMSDVDMPRMGGLEFLSAIRKLDLEVIVIVFTGLGNEKIALESMQRDANDFIRKPFHHKDLIPIIEKYAGIVESRKKGQETPNLMMSKTFVLEFDNQLKMVPLIVRQILQEVGNTISAEHQLGVRIGLTELIVNAIEHGNLGISYEEKQAAMATDMYGFDTLVSARLAKPELAGRRVIVEGWLTKEQWRWKVSDDGEGFDWTSLSTPLSPENLEQPNGRGIFIAQLQFDRLEFLGKGNQVQITKRIKK